MRTIYNMLVSLLICAALFLAPVTAANYDADFDLDTEMIGGLCPLSTAVINADLENTGVLDDEYMLSSSSSWVTIGSPHNLEIKAGEKEFWSIFVTPGINALPGEYRVAVTAESEATGEKYTKFIYISVLGCYGVEIETDVDSIGSCVGAEEKIIVTVSNVGKFDEVFSLDSNYGYFETNKISVGSMDEEIVVLTVPVVSKNQDVEINVHSGSIGAEKTVPIVSENSCYSVAVLNVPQEVSVCQGDVQIIDVTVKNTGALEDSYVLANSFGLPFGKSTLTVGSKQVDNTILTIPTHKFDAGVYDYTITVSSDNTEDRIDGILVVENCYSASINVLQDSKMSCPLAERVFKLTVENTGKKRDNYQLISDRGELLENSISLAPGGIVEVNLALTSKPYEAGERQTVVILKSANTEETIEINEIIQEMYVCYDMDVSVEPVRAESDDYDGMLYTVTVKNLGYFDNIYTARLTNNPSWVYVDPAEFGIDADDSRDIFVYVSPDMKAGNGVYTFVLTVENNGGISKDVPITYVFTGSDKPMADVSPDTVPPVYVDDDVESSEDDSQGYSLSSILVALAIGLIIVLLIVFGPDLLKDTEDEDELDRFFETEKIEPPVTAAKIESGFNCEVCGKVFSSERSLRIHKSVVHRETPKKEAVVVKKQKVKKAAVKAPAARKAVKTVAAKTVSKKVVVTPKKRATVPKKKPVSRGKVQKKTDDRLKNLKSTRKDDIRKILDSI